MLRLLSRSGLNKKIQLIGNRPVNLVNLVNLVNFCSTVIVGYWIGLGLECWRPWSSAEQERLVVVWIDCLAHMLSLPTTVKSIEACKGWWSSPIQIMERILCKNPGLASICWTWIRVGLDSGSVSAPNHMQESILCGGGTQGTAEAQDEPSYQEHWRSILPSSLHQNYVAKESFYLLK